MKKKIISLLTAISIVCSAMPAFNIYALADDTQVISDINENIEITDFTDTIADDEDEKDYKGDTAAAVTEGLPLAAFAASIAKIGETEYATLQEAINAAEDSAEITLLDNVTESVTIPAGKNITLNLNNHKITSTTTAEKPVAVKNSGTVKITNGTIEGEGGTDFHYALYNNPGAKAVLNNVKLINTKNKGVAVRNYGELEATDTEIQAEYYPVRVYEDSKTTMTTSSIVNTSGKCGIQANGGTVVLNDTNITADDQAIQCYDTANVTINGGTITATGTEKTAVFVDGKDNKCPTLNVKGATIKAEAYAISGNGGASGTGTIINIYEGSDLSATADDGVAIYHPQINGKLNIYGGTVQGVTGIEIRAGELNVYGGTIKTTADKYQELVY